METRRNALRLSIASVSSPSLPSRDHPAPRPCAVAHALMELLAGILDDPPDAATFEAWMMLGNPIPAVHTDKKLAGEIQAHPHPVTLVQNLGKGKDFVPSPDASRHLTAMLR
jgi:hypothetical protein